MKGLIRVMAAVAAVICVCGAATHSPLRTISLNHDIFDIEFSPYGRTLAVSTADIPMPPYTKDSNGYPGAPLSGPPGPPPLRHPALCLCDLRVPLKVRRLPGKALYVAFAFSPDGRRLATSEYGGTITLWDVARGARLRTIRLPDEARDLYVGAHGVTVVTSGGLVGFWPAAGGRVRPLFHLGNEEASAALVQEGWRARFRPLFQPGDEEVFSAAFSCDGKLLATGGGWNDPWVRLWSIPRRKLIWRASGHTNAVDSVAFSPDMKRVASGSWDGTVRIWDAASGKLLHRLDGGGDNVWSVAFSPDGHKIADAGPDVRIWDADTGRLLRVIHRSGFAVAFSPDGRTLAVVVGDTVELWR